MKTVCSSSQIRNLVRKLEKKSMSIGFVPTMGYLHEGHLSLARRARKENDVVVVSIFVNPAQFGQGEDYGSYPRDPDRDLKLLTGLADYVFMPDVGQIYGRDEKITFVVRDIADCLCGVSRPNHFPGVIQVLAKLLNLIRPRRIYLGRKDYQQTVAVQHLVRELFFDTKVVVCPTVREPGGLAMSSRNKYLSPAEKSDAGSLSRALKVAEMMLKQGEKNPLRIIAEMKEVLNERKHAGIDYIDIREADTLGPVSRIGRKPVVVALAVKYGKTRLIDNIIFKPPSHVER